MLLNGRFQRTLVGSHDLSDSLLVLEQHERWHGPDVELLSDIEYLVHVDLVEFDIGEFFGHGDDFGRDGLARSTPGGEAVEDDKLVAGVD